MKNDDDDECLLPTAECYLSQHPFVLTTESQKSHVARTLYIKIKLNANASA